MTKDEEILNDSYFNLESELRDITQRRIKRGAHESSFNVCQPWVYKTLKLFPSCLPMGRGSNIR